MDRDALKVLIIGTGFGGLCMAIQLKKAGISNFTLLEKASRVGGTWRDNVYPGAACDVQSLLYSYSFEPKSDWSRKYAPQNEIFQYLEACASKYGLLQSIKFNKEVVSARFDDSSGVWTINTADGETERAHVLIVATGQLNQPAYPKLKGIETFAGETFHSARWNHAYDFTNKAVAVIGTGASAIQFVPQIVKAAKAVKLFQRSAAWIIAKPDRPYTRLEKWLFRNIPVTARLSRYYYYLKNESRALAFTGQLWITRSVELETRWLAWRAVKDPAKREQLIPDYRAGCKRILISNDWFPAMDHNRLEVVTGDIDRVESDTIVTKDGKRHAVDTIVYGTGFQATDFLASMTITGLNGQRLADAWREGAEAYKGICVSGFPNFFLMYGPNTNLSHSSLVYMLECQAHYILQCIKELATRNLKFMNVKSAPQSDFVEDVQSKIKGSIWSTGCSSWYQTSTGRNTSVWPSYTFHYRAITKTCDLNDFELRPAADAAAV